MPIDWSFSVGVCHTVNSLSLSVTDWNYLDHQYSESVSNKNLALHWQQDSCPGTTLIFLVLVAEPFEEWSFVHL